MVLSWPVFRWGDYPEKLEAAYIQSRVESGVWFDNAEKFKLVILRVFWSNCNFYAYKFP
jgi:hypothetical protein